MVLRTILEIIRILFRYADNTHELCRCKHINYVVMPTKNGKKKEIGPVYANLLCDFMFKRLFGSEANKDVLIAFLNMLLEDSEIVDVDFIPTEHLGLTKEDRKAIFDISCKCKDGSSFIIEMQKGYQKYFRERAIYYTTYPINEQGRNARDMFVKDHPEENLKTEFKWDYDLKPVTMVAILNFKFSHDENWPKDRIHSSYRLREDTTGEIMTDVLRFVFLELGRFKKHIWELETVSDKWMYLLKHMHEMDEIPEKFSDPLFRRLFMLSEIGNFTADELKQYEESMKDMSDYYNIIDTAAEEAEKRGMLKGLEIGREEERATIVKKMLEAGMSHADIAKISGLDKEHIQKIL